MKKNNEKIKVLMVAGSMHVGGIENQLMHLVRNADKNKFRFDFTSTMSEAACREEIEQLGGRFILISDMNWKWPFPYCRTMYKIMKEGQYDVVHSHELFHTGITLFIAALAGVPCRFAHAHNWCDSDGTDQKRSVLRSIYNVVMRKMICLCSTAQIACSSWAGEFVYGKKTMQKSTYHLVFNSVDTEKFLDRYDQIESGEYIEQDGWKNVLNVARVSAVKNQIFLTEVARELKTRGDKIRILCAGSGDKDILNEVKNNIEKYELQEHMILLGIRKDIDVLMRKSSAFVLPSKYEGMPLVMIEAQTSGLNCVSANTYSPEVDFGIDTVTWLPLETGAKAWADALEKVVTKGRAHKEDVEKAILKKKFNSKLFAETLCRLYEDDYQLRKGK